jgi:hypothetical protein
MNEDIPPPFDLPALARKGGRRRLRWSAFYRLGVIAKQIRNGRNPPDLAVPLSRRRGPVRVR